MTNRLIRFAAAWFVLILLCAAGSNANAQAGTASKIPAADLLQPSELAQILQSPTGEKPLILQVGFLLMYQQAHIPGSEFIGPVNREAGLHALQNRVSKLDRAQSVVLYCGCCPWSKCPNIWSAYQQMHSMGFTHLKVLYLADNFGADWVDKGYPVARK